MKFLKKLIILEQGLLRKVSKNTTALKIIALCIALLFFMILNGVGPASFGDLFEVDAQITDINVNVITDDDKIFTGIPEKIAVNIHGSETAVQTFQENYKSVMATVNLSGRENGEYEIDKNEFKFSKNYGVEITPLVDSYDVKIDTLTEVTMPIDIEYINKEKDNSVILSDPVLEQADVTFPVGESQISSIASVKLILDVSEIDAVAESGTHVYNEQIKVYDNDGNLMEFTQELPTVKVTQEYVTNVILMPVKYQIINNNTKKYVSYVCKVEDDTVYDENCQDEVEVYGNESIIQNLGYITYNVDLTNYDENSQEILATPSLENGVYVKESTGYNVKIGLEEGETTTFKNIPITIENLDNNLEVKNLDKINLSIDVTGSKTIIDNLTNKDFEVYIDASEITGPTTARMPLQVSINNLLTYELNEKEVNVQFIDKEETSDE